jgi:hypothetical protein
MEWNEVLEHELMVFDNTNLTRNYRYKLHNYPFKDQC